MSLLWPFHTQLVALPPIPPWGSAWLWVKQSRKEAQVGKKSLHEHCRDLPPPGESQSRQSLPGHISRECPTPSVHLQLGGSRALAIGDASLHNGSSPPSVPAPTRCPLGEKSQPVNIYCTLIEYLMSAMPVLGAEGPRWQMHLSCPTGSLVPGRRRMYNLGLPHPVFLPSLHATTLRGYLGLYRHCSLFTSWIHCVLLARPLAHPLALCALGFLSVNGR